MLIQNAIKKIILYNDLTQMQMYDVMKEIMTGQATVSQIAGLLVGMQMKGATVAEITGAATVLRDLSKKMHINATPLVDIVGTGGDGAATFNISTTCAFILAGSNAIVAKHGNISVSSRCGSADVLKEAGVNITLPIEKVQRCIEKIGIGFLFAPLYHEAMQHASTPRKELGVRTFFNLLGPLTNPANAPFLVIGVYEKKWVLPFAEVLRHLNCQHALIVHSHDGLDEISIAAPTFVAELNNQNISTYEIEPEHFGFKKQSLNAIKVDNAKDSYQMMQQVLTNTQGTARDIALLNSGAAIYVAGLASSIAQGIQIAKDTLESGKAYQKLQQLIEFTQHA